LLAGAVVIGFLIGWRFVGARIESSGMGVLVLGLNAAVLHFFWTILGAAFVEMIRWSLRRRYDDPLEALVDAITISMKYIQTYMTWELIACGLIGGVLAGLGALGALQKWG
jgi:uncharacterized membrane-anchored protein YitT (DUF2179 family)